MKYTQTQIKEKMSKLMSKWKDNVPTKFTRDWWTYRGDRSLYLMLKSKLKNSADQIKIAKQVGLI